MNKNELFIDSKLPNALTKAELFECIKAAKNGDLGARDKIIKHNIKLVLNRVSKNYYNTLYDKDELVSVGIIGLIKAVDTFDIDKGFEFSTYASKCINNEILQFIRKNDKFINIESLDEILQSIVEGDKLRRKDMLVSNDSCVFGNLEERELILEIRKQINMLGDRDSEVIKLYFGFYSDKRYTQEEIGIMMGISRPLVSKIIKNSVKKIMNNLKKLGIIEIKTKENRFSYQESNSIISKEGYLKNVIIVALEYGYFDKSCSDITSFIKNMGINYKDFNDDDLKAIFNECKNNQTETKNQDSINAKTFSKKM